MCRKASLALRELTRMPRQSWPCIHLVNQLAWVSRRERKWAGVRYVPNLASEAVASSFRVSVIMVSVKLKESVGLNEFGRSGGRPLLFLGEWDFESIDFWPCIFGLRRVSKLSARFVFVGRKVTKE